MIRLDMVYDRVLDIKFNVNYKTAIKYDLKYHYTLKYIIILF
jgi:hypothetical protein